MKGRVVAIIGLLACALTHAAEDAPLQERMSREEFGRAGLDKLTTQELDFLNAWLQNKVVEPMREEVEAVKSEKEERMGFHPRPGDRSVIESEIDGEFSGWSGGRTRFTLKNGQVWQQVDSGTVYYRVDSPAVRIEPKSLGSWKMYVEGLGRGVKVKRIK